MQENIKPITAIIRPSQGMWYLSIAFAVVVGGLTAFFLTFSWIRDSNITSIQTEIEGVQQQITLISEDRKILIANIIKNNTLRPSLDLFPIIREFRIAAAKANVRLKGFSIADDTISTSLIATIGDPGVHPDPAATVIKMMRDYAQGKMNFTLEPITSLSGDSTMRTTGVEFHVLPSKIQ